MRTEIGKPQRNPEMTGRSDSSHPRMQLDDSADSDLADSESSYQADLGAPELSRRKAWAIVFIILSMTLAGTIFFWSAIFSEPEIPTAISPVEKTAWDLNKQIRKDEANARLLARVSFAVLSEEPPRFVLSGAVDSAADLEIARQTALRLLPAGDCEIKIEIQPE